MPDIFGDRYRLVEPLPQDSGKWREVDLSKVEYAGLRRAKKALERTKQQEIEWRREQKGMSSWRDRQDAKCVDQRRSTCSICKYGIFTGQEAEWTSIGLIHTECGKDEVEGDT